MQPKNVCWWQIKCGVYQHLTYDTLVAGWSGPIGEEQLAGMVGGGLVWKLLDTTITTITTAVSVTGATGVNDVKHATAADTQTQDAKSRRSPTILSHQQVQKVWRRVSRGNVTGGGGQGADGKPWWRLFCENIAHSTKQPPTLTQSQMPG